MRPNDPFASVPSFGFTSSFGFGDGFGGGFGGDSFGHGSNR